MNCTAEKMNGAQNRLKMVGQGNANNIFICIVRGYSRPPPLQRMYKLNMAKRYVSGTRLGPPSSSEKGQDEGHLARESPRNSALCIHACWSSSSRSHVVSFYVGLSRKSCLVSPTKCVILLSFLYNSFLQWIRLFLTRSWHGWQMIKQPFPPWRIAASGTSIQNMRCEPSVVYWYHATIWISASELIRIQTGTKTVVQEDHSEKRNQEQGYRKILVSEDPRIRSLARILETSP